tara:strand:+ start:286 stop:789 length:504 start_codon:yes stop_codon:yes gene_type:complete
MRHSKSTTLNVDKSLFPVFMALVDTGGMAFAWTDEMLKQETGGVDFANRTLDLVHSLAEQFSKGKGVIVLDEEDYLHVLTGIRGALESFITLGKEEIVDMYLHYNPNLKLPKGKDVDIQTLTIHANIVLDFLECHAPSNVINKWVNKRKDASVSRLEHLIDTIHDQD